jgi:putative lipoprotein
MKFHYLPLLFIPILAIADDERIPYTCDNGNHIDISFFTDNSGRPQASLHFADETIVLPQVPSGASGALYRNGDIRLHTKGDDAIFEDGKRNMRRCARGNLPPAAPRPAPPAVASSFMEVTGHITYLTRNALRPMPSSPSSSRKRRTLVEQRYELNGAQVPIPFSATIDRDLISQKARIAITAQINAGGKLRFSSSKVYPVIKNKQAQPVNIILKPSGHAKAH